MSDRYLDDIQPSYGWIKGMAIFWLLLGVSFLCFGIADYLSGDPARARGRAITLVVGSLYTIIPIGILLRTRWGFWGGFGLSMIMFLGFPIGTILAFKTMKAYADNKFAFGIL